MVYTIKKLEFKKLEWRLGCKTCIVYTGLKTLYFEVENLLPNHIFESCNIRPMTTHVCIYLNTRSDHRVHLDNKSIDRDL